MRVVVVGANGGIGSAICDLYMGAEERPGHLRSVARPARADEPFECDAVVCCNGSGRGDWFDNYTAGVEWLPYARQIWICMSGGGVGGAPSLDLNPDYVAAKSALVALTEYSALKYPHRQFFCVAPGLTATKMTGYKGADPRIPAAFIVKLLSGKYGHLSGSLLAAQRDDLDTMKPMKLRRVECP